MMKTRVLAMTVSLMLLALAACAEPAKVESAKKTAGKSTAKTTTDTTSAQDKTLYALGVAMARGLRAYDLSNAELDVIKRGLTDSVLGHDLEIEETKVQQMVQAFVKERQEKMAAAEKEAGKEVLEKAAAEEGAVKTESGLIIKEIEPGTGESPKATDRVKVHYHGTLRDGSVFDSSVERGTPATFPLNRVIPCWTEGVQKMKVGGKSKLTCPSDIAYGDRGSPPKIKPGSVLVFEVELLEIVKKPSGDKKPGAKPREGEKKAGE